MRLYIFLSFKISELFTIYFCFPIFSHKINLPEFDKNTHYTTIHQYYTLDLKIASLRISTMRKYFLTRYDVIS